MRKITNDMITGVDGQTVDILRVITLLGFFSYITLAAYDVYTGNKFNLTEFATGLGIIYASSGIGIAAKAHTEPTLEQTNSENVRITEQDEKIEKSNN